MNETRAHTACLLGLGGALLGLSGRLFCRGSLLDGGLLCLGGGLLRGGRLLGGSCGLLGGGLLSRRLLDGGLLGCGGGGLLGSGLLSLSGGLLGCGGGGLLSGSGLLGGGGGLLGGSGLLGCVFLGEGVLGVLGDLVVAAVLHEHAALDTSAKSLVEEVELLLGHIEGGLKGGEGGALALLSLDDGFHNLVEKSHCPS